MKLLKISLITFSFFYPLFSDDNKTKIYLDKLPKYNEEIEINASKEALKEIGKDFNLTDFSKSMEIDEETFKKKYGDMKIIEDENASSIAKEIDNMIKTKEFQSLVKQNEDYLLYDKSINFSQHTGLSKQELEDLRTGSFKGNKSESENELLSHDEKIFIVFSSSIPKETMKNYFKTLEKVNTDVTFILQGVVGNDISKIMPTLEYIQDLLKKDNTDDEVYHFRVDINPKVTQKFNITHVPAILYIQNYDSNLQENQDITHSSDEKYFIVYGDSDFTYAIGEIQKKVKSKGLDALLKEMNKTFYN